MPPLADFGKMLFLQTKDRVRLPLMALQEMANYGSWAVNCLLGRSYPRLRVGLGQHRAATRRLYRLL
jgi:hypothetical protein